MSNPGDRRIDPPVPLRDLALVLATALDRGQDLPTTVAVLHAHAGPVPWLDPDCVLDVVIAAHSLLAGLDVSLGEVFGVWPSGLFLDTTVWVTRELTDLHAI